jgi:hypothetical protein
METEHSEDDVWYCHTKVVNVVGPESRGMPDFGAFLPLLLTQEGGEGRGEEARFVEIPLSPALSPLVPHGERENLSRYK